MDDLIKRQDAIDIVTFECGEWQGIANRINEQIQRLPSAEPVQKTGKWIQAEDIPTEYVVCTNCKGLGKSYMDYCWHCGSRNRGDTDDEI